VAQGAATFFEAIKQAVSKQLAILASIWQVCSTFLRKNLWIHVFYHVAVNKVLKIEFLGVFLQ